VQQSDKGVDALFVEDFRVIIEDGDGSLLGPAGREAPDGILHGPYGHASRGDHAIVRYFADIDAAEFLPQAEEILAKGRRARIQQRNILKRIGRGDFRHERQGGAVERA
jgi:hypothetical protein